MIRLLGRMSLDADRMFKGGYRSQIDFSSVELYIDG
jgi:hypothetical protein